MACIDKDEANLRATAKKQRLNATDPLEKCKLSLLSRGSAGIKNISRWFRIMDDDGNRKLNLVEFKDGMRGFGINDITDAEFNEMFERFDEDGSGQINVTEFLMKMQPKMSDCRMDLVKQAFNKFDITNDGVITTEDLKKYDVTHHPKYANGEYTRKQCLQEFLDSFDDKKHIDHKITLDEFIAYYSALSCSIDNHSYFDLMMRRAWRLD